MKTKSAVAMMCALFAVACAEQKVAAPGVPKQVSRQCGSCHKVPEPQDLPQQAWPYLLDLMGLYFGYDDGELLAPIRDEYLRRQLFDIDRYPGEPVLAREEWLAIRKYFEASSAADKAPPPPDGDLLTLFAPTKVYFPDPAPVTSLVTIPASGNGFHLGDARAQMLRAFDAGGRMVASEPIPGVPVQLETKENAAFLVLIGNLAPSNMATGAIAQKTATRTPWRAVADELYRPVHALFADFDGDGDTDIFVCEFGHYIGRIAIYEQQENRQYMRHVISTEPGAVSARLLYIRKDGLPDVLLLNAQAREGVELLRNRGDFSFEREILLEKPPGYGYTDLHLVDLDMDGVDEVLTVNGDNGDLPGPPLKAYHGLRIHRVFADYRLEEIGFLHLPGAFRAAPADFDNDGDIDIAAISFFPDPRAVEQGFAYFENLEAMRFDRKLISEGAIAPWMTVAAGDVDGDGDVDLVLGSGFVNAQQQAVSGIGGSQPAALLLRNRSIARH